MACIIFDFDRTLFDTDRFKYAYPSLSSTQELPSGFFAQGELRHFVYEDVVPVLTDLCRRGHQLMILTYGVHSLQRGKIHSTGVDHYIQQVIVTDQLKGEEWKKRVHVDMSPSPRLFIDDTVTQLRSMQMADADILCIHMHRSGPVCQDQPCVSDLTGVSNYLDEAG